MKLAKKADAVTAFLSHFVQTCYSHLVQDINTRCFTMLKSRWLYRYKFCLDILTFRVCSGSVARSGQTFTVGCCPDFRAGQPLVLHLLDLSRHWYVHVKKKTPLFWNRYQPDMHYIVPVNSTILLWKILKHCMLF